jgi:adenylate cyclase
MLGLRRFVMAGLLFIDDEEGIRRSIVRALDREFYEVFTAGDGNTGIDILKKHVSRISTVISDFRMPGIDGLQTLMVVYKLNPEITRIILTGYASVETAIEATNQGIDGFLTKPFDNMELRAKIHDISVRKYLRQFVPESVFQEMNNSAGILKPRYHEVSILFSDIRGFTRMSRDIPPEMLAHYLNDYFFTPMGEIAHAFHGTVDKHIGDSMMVVYGVPISREDDPAMAVKSAVLMQAKAREINKGLGQKKNGFRLRLGIGISTGKVFSGVLGSVRKKEFTSIGLAVNIAARLQGLAREGEVLITEDTLARLPDRIIARPLAPVPVKGVDKPIRIYRVEP